MPSENLLNGQYFTKRPNVWPFKVSPIQIFAALHFRDIKYSQFFLNRMIQNEFLQVNEFSEFFQLEFHLELLELTFIVKLCLVHLINQIYNLVRMQRLAYKIIYHE